MSDLNALHMQSLRDIAGRLRSLAPMWQGLYGKQANQAFADSTFIEGFVLNEGAIKTIAIEALEKIGEGCDNAAETASMALERIKDIKARNR